MAVEPCPTILGPDSMAGLVGGRCRYECEVGLTGTGDDEFFEGRVGNLIAVVVWAVSKIPRRRETGLQCIDHIRFLVLEPQISHKHPYQVPFSFSEHRKCSYIRVSRISKVSVVHD